MNKKSSGAFYGRRKFLNNATRIAGASMVMGMPGISIAEKPVPGTAVLTVRQVIDIILKEIPAAPFPKTVDQLRSGNMEQEVSGIVTTMFPTIEVIKKTAKAGANFIIAHETPFYNNEDETDWLKEDDAYRHKAGLLDKYKIAVWRFHDYWHAHKPDGIIMGNLIKLGWEKYYDAGNPRMITLPQPMSVRSVTAHIKEKLGIPSVRLVGNLDQKCTTIYMAFGYMDSKRQIAVIQESEPDLILSGENREWETTERVRDGLLMGKKTNLLVLSHAVSEEAGMEYAAKWLQPKIKGIKVLHIPAGNPFQYV